MIIEDEIEYDKITAQHLVKNVNTKYKNKKKLL